MRIITIILFFSLTSFANIIDDLNIYNAQKSYEEKNYNEALQYLSKVKKEDSKVFYNLGNIFYKLGKYEEAIKEYKKVQNKDLLHNINHNIANCYLMLENFDNAIKYYNKALVHENNQRTIYNLEMTKKKQIELNNRQIRSLNENVCEIQRKGLIEELTVDSIFDYFELDENTKLYQDRQMGIRSRNENSRLTVDDIQRSISIDEENKTTTNESKKEFKMNSYFEEKFDNKNIDDAKTLIVPMKKGIVDDNKKAW